MCIDFKQIGKFMLEKLRKVRDFFAVSAGEAAYILLMFIIMLVINYLLIAMNGFSLSYSKIWPPLSCLNDVIPLLFFLLTGHFICRRNRWFLWGVTTAQFLILFILLAIYFTTGTFFCESVLYLVYDTTWEETEGFFSAYVSFKSLLILTVIAAAYFVSLYFAMKLYQPAKKYCAGDLGAIGVIVLILLWPAVNTVRSGEWNVVSAMFQTHPLNGIYEHIRSFNRHAGEFIVEMRHRTPPDYVVLAPELAEEPPIGVLVIGESAIRSHHSIYGYERNTTPNLLARRDAIIAFDDTIAVLPMTITALKYWLTNMTLENRHVAWTVFDALKVAGYRIDVITNQNKSGWADSPLQMIFSTADSITYMHEENFSDLQEDRDAGIYDGILLPSFIQWVAVSTDRKADATPRLAVVHLFGSHEPYASRYPADFSRIFLDDTGYSPRVNEYDTSVLYTDMVLGRMLEELEKLDRPAYLVYISDHGSVCDTERLRTPGSEENTAYEVPFLIWTNRRYRELMADTVRRMNDRRHVPLQADRAHFGLLEMMGIIFTKDVERENFLSENFMELPRFIREGQAPYIKE